MVKFKAGSRMSNDAKEMFKISENKTWAFPQNITWVEGFKKIMGVFLIFSQKPFNLKIIYLIV